MISCLLCCNHVKDFDTWYTVFKSHESAQKSAGLHLLKLWQTLHDPNIVYFIFQIDDIKEAARFLNNPEAKKAGELAGVISGEFHFLEEIPF